MLLRVIAVGTRMPDWVQTAVTDYSRRLPAGMDLQWREVKAEPRGQSRTGGDSPHQAAVWMQREARRIREALPAAAHRVVLDEQGRDLDTAGLARRLAVWREAARPVAILIGGPDGLDAGLMSECEERLRLSSLTLPHPMVRVILAEQIYRAWTILSGHPYHRA